MNKLAKAWDKAAHAGGLITTEELRKRTQELGENAKGMFSYVRAVASEVGKQVGADETSEAGKMFNRGKEGVSHVGDLIAKGKNFAMPWAKKADASVEDFLTRKGYDGVKKMKANVFGFAGVVSSTMKKKSGIIKYLDKTLGADALAESIYDAFTSELLVATYTKRAVVDKDTELLEYMKEYGFTSEEVAKEHYARLQDKKKRKDTLAKKAEAAKAKAEKKAQKKEEKKATEEGRIKKLEEKKSGKGEVSNESEEKEKGKSRFMTTMGKWKDKLDAHRESLKDAKAAKKGEGKGFLGAILGALGGLAMTLLGGIGKIMGKTAIYLAGKFTKALGWMGGKLLKGIWTALKLVTKASWATKGISAVANLATSTALRTAGGMALGALGTAASAVAFPLLVVGGVAALGVGAYYAYKRYSRNDASDLQKLRMMHYGLGEAQKDSFHLIYQLESIFKKYLRKGTGNREGQFSVSNISGEDNDAMYEIFEVTNKPEDESRRNALIKWINGRAIPVYSAHTTAVFTAKNGTYLEDVNSLNDQQKLAYLKGISIPTGVYDCLDSPINGYPKITLSKTDIDAAFTKLVNESSTKAKKSERTNSDVTINKNAEDARKAAAEAEKAKLAASNAASASTTPSSAKPPPIATNPNTESTANGAAAGSNKPTASTGSPPAAGGPLMKGTGDLTGITLKKGARLEGVDPAILANFGGMAAEYNRLTGKNITVNQGFRTYEEQASLKRSKGAGAASPGHSPHEFGLALDIASVHAAELEKLGLMKKYGFTRPIGGETWHVEPAGISLDPERAKRDAMFRAAAVDSSPGRGGGGLGSTPGTSLGRRDIGLQKKLYANGTMVTIKADKTAPTPDAGESTTINGSTADASSAKPPKVAASESAASTAYKPNVPASDKPLTVAAVTSSATRGSSPGRGAANSVSNGSTNSRGGPSASTPEQLPKEQPKAYSSTMVKPVNTQAENSRSPDSYSVSASSNTTAIAQMADISKQQLQVLNRIADLLNSIDGKFDPKALAEILAKRAEESKPAPQQQSSYNTPVGRSKSAVSTARGSGY